MMEGLLRKSYLAKLGDFVFDLESLPFQKLDRDSAYRWASLSVFGREPLKHYLGPDSEKINISGTIYPHFRGGLGQIDKLRSMARQGKPFLLVAMDSKIGQSLGQWIIKAIKEARTIFLDNGVPQKIEFTLEIESYVPPL
mgnify:CR=1 FL=1